MTIKLEREALLTVLSRTPQQQAALHHDVESLIGGTDNEFVLVSLPKTDGADFQQNSSVSLKGLSTYDSFDEDDCCTVTTTSSSSSFCDEPRRVTFAEPLVTEVRTRPRTPKEEVSNLFYTVDETQRFRQEYRLERRLLAELDVDAATQAANEEELSMLFETTEPLGRHGISRVVVLHNDKIETFCTPQPSSLNLVTEASDDFFDNDSFWSGSITWY